MATAGELLRTIRRLQGSVTTADEASTRELRRAVEALADLLKNARTITDGSITDAILRSISTLPRIEMDASIPGSESLTVQPVEGDLNSLASLLLQQRIEERRQLVIRTAEAVEHAVTILLNDRATFAKFRDAVNASPAVRQTHFPMLVARWYSQSVLLGLRRLGDQDKRTYSLRALFDRMIANPDEWSLSSIIEIWDSDEHRYEQWMLETLAQKTYKEFADETGSILNVDRVTADRERLEAGTETAKLVVDKTIAHAEIHKGDAPTMTFAELDAAIDACHEMVRPYIALITGRGYNNMTPIPQTVWWRIFEPWKSMKPFPE